MKKLLVLVCIGIVGSSLYAPTKNQVVNKPMTAVQEKGALKSTKPAAITVPFVPISQNAAPSLHPGSAGCPQDLARSLAPANAAESSEKTLFRSIARQAAEAWNRPEPKPDLTNYTEMFNYVRDCIRLAQKLLSEVAQRSPDAADQQLMAGVANRLKTDQEVEQQELDKVQQAARRSMPSLENNIVDLYLETGRINMAYSLAKQHGAALAMNLMGALVFVPQVYCLIMTLANKVADKLP